MKKLFYMLILVGILAGASAIFVPPYLSVSSNQDVVEVTVPKGASLNHVSNELYEKGVIKNKAWFKYKAKDAGVDRKIKPGTYTIPSNITLENIFALLEKGIPDEQMVLTIPEGFTLYQIAQRVSDLGFGTTEDFIDATQRYFEKEGYDFPTKDLFFSLEGYLYPETYYFTERQSVDDIVRTLAEPIKNIFTEEYKSRAKELDLSIHQVLTIASLIEREAVNDEERPMISGVIHNRLEKNMLLQIDASVIYYTGKGREHKSDIYKSELEKMVPFNTYRVPGLPPGPIASPSKASIDAALYPEEHDFLFYVLNETEDKHIFSKTLAEHEVHAQKYRNRNKK